MNSIHKKRIAVSAAVCLGLLIGITPLANALYVDNPQPRNPSAYGDASELGRNVIDQEDLGAINPSVTGGEDTVSAGQKVEYSYDVQPGFPADTENVTAQRWVKITLAEDPKIPFDDSAIAAGKSGIPSDAKVSGPKVVDGKRTWTILLGAEYAKNGDAIVNNASNWQWTNTASNRWPKGKAWVPEDFQLRIPATVENVENVDPGETIGEGTIQVTSGRVIDAKLTDGIGKAQFVRRGGGIFVCIPQRV